MVTPLQSTHKQVYAQRLGQQSARSAQRGKHNRTLTLPRFHLQFTTQSRRNAHTGNETFKKGVVIDSLALKYKPIFKNSQQKRFSTKRPSKNGQKKPNGQPKTCTAKFAKRSTWQPVLTLGSVPSTSDCLLLQHQNFTLQFHISEISRPYSFNTSIPLNQIFVNLDTPFQQFNNKKM